MNYKEYLETHCDGAGPHSGVTVKRYPLGAGGNLHLCFSCWANENRFRFNSSMGVINPDEWPQYAWNNGTDLRKEEEESNAV